MVSPWPVPYNARGLRNAATERWHGSDAARHQNLEEERARYADAEARGDLSGSAVWAGEAVDLVHDILPASAIIEQTVSKAAELLSEGSNYTLISPS